MMSAKTFSIGQTPLAALVLIGSLAALGGCAHADRSPVFSAAYACDDGQRFTVLFESEAALVRLPDSNTVRLAQQRAASGMSYAAEGYELRGKGDDATWKTPGTAPVRCKSV